MLVLFSARRPSLYFIWKGRGQHRERLEYERKNGRCLGRHDRKAAQMEGRGKARGGLREGGGIVQNCMKGGKGASQEASPRDHFTGKIRKISSQGSIWQRKEVASPENRIGSQMAKD